LKALIASRFRWTCAGVEMATPSLQVTTDHLNFL